MKRSELLVLLASESLTARQLYASSCLRRYCQSRGISHASIEALLTHLDGIATSRNLAEWDLQGAALELNGRGDDVPESLRSVLTSEDLNELTALVDCVVEVGLIDLYGIKTDVPLKFLDGAIQTLEKRAIPLPPLTGQRL